MSQTFILPEGKDSLLDFVGLIEGSDARWEFTVKRFVKKRTNSQNSLLWGVVYPQCAVFFGVSKDEIHEGMGDMFLPRQRNKVTGKEYPVSTTSLNTEQFNEYVEKICAYWATEHGLYIEIGGGHE